MAKLAIAVFMAALVCQVLSKPLLQDGDIAEAAMAGDWTGLQNILRNYYISRSRVAAQPPSAYELKSGPYTAATNGESSPGGRYYTQSEYSYQRSHNNNGVVSKDKGGLGMINDNGRVSYYTPSSPSYDLSLPGYYGDLSPYQG